MARILIADDDDLMGCMLQNALMDAGHAVGLLGNGYDALRTILTMRPHLVILDCDMPEMHGVAVLKHIRCDQALWNLPVLMLTGCRSQSDEDIALYAGANAYLRKPCDPAYVVFRVEEALEALRTSDEQVWRAAN
ncbi:response regulator [Novosphingobium album (ex Liu et al. 2023)]|uniref:Response regulator n=1 Tax=Novosphingobium album (ex Liu et al. 2023) TaxID=3031130 RepID=A0ABT5WVW2_9SPHN|nr:response regulator [Novosphingobium album (ex Liu et al. 2023)]MDE8654027.1 response regulator [Novosphingobium album (ex Liu et al. 2023)]